MYDYAIQVGQFKTLSHQLERAREINMLENAKVKYDKENIVFAIKDNNGRLYWLEHGNNSVGLKHIINRHKNAFNKAYGVKEKDIAGFIKNMILSGTIIAERQKIRYGKVHIEQNYKYMGKYYTLNAVGTNGFIVSCYPINVEENIWLLLDYC